jgi:regulator of sigma E protease
LSHFVDVILNSLGVVASLLKVAIGLGIVIFVHELGHFAVAKWVGVLVERFSIGFGPVLWSFRRNETEYAISAIPFGGYVKMLGQDDANPGEMAKEENRIDPRAYPAQSVPKRMAIISAGVIMNLIFGALFFVAVFNLGCPYTPPIVGSVDPGSPAWQAGIEVGDRVLSVNGNEAIDFSEHLMQEVMLTGRGETVDLEVARGDERLSFHVVPRLRELAPQIGVRPMTDLRLVKDSPTMPGSAAADAKGAVFQGGDTIVSVNDRPVSTFDELSRFVGRHAGDELRVGVRRASGDPAGSAAAAETAEVIVAPQYMRDLGVRLQMGRITAVRKGSPAEAAGIQVGDVIHSFDRRSGAEEALDPLRLPDKVAQMVGSEVAIELKRASQPDQLVTVKLRVDDHAAWDTPPLGLGSPIALAGLGITYQIVPAILDDPAPNSPAHRAGLRRDDLVCGVTLIPDPESKSKPREFMIDDDHPNLPVVFWALQESPTTKLKLKVKRNQQTVETDTFDPAFDHSWPATHLRGMNVGYTLAGRLPPQGFTRSLQLGLRTTVTTLNSVRLTIRGLVRQTVSPELIQGPIGIFATAYHVAASDFVLLIKFLALLSVNLAIINFLPIPVLDGGHMVFLAWEWVRGKPASERVLVVASYCGLFLILALVLFVSTQDIRRWFD